MVKLFVLLALVVGLAGCGNIQKLTKERAGELAARWTAENPGVKMSPEVSDAIVLQAGAEVLEEEAVKKRDIADESIDVFNDLATGNYVGAGLGALGILATWMGWRKRKKKPAPAAPPAV